MIVPQNDESRLSGLQKLSIQKSNAKFSSSSDWSDDTSGICEENNRIIEQLKYIHRMNGKKKKNKIIVFFYLTLVAGDEIVEESISNEWMDTTRELLLNGLLYLHGCKSKDIIKNEAIAFQYFMKAHHLAHPRGSYKVFFYSILHPLFFIILIDSIRFFLYYSHWFDMILITIIPSSYLLYHPFTYYHYFAILIIIR